MSGGLCMDCEYWTRMGGPGVKWGDCGLGYPPFIEDMIDIDGISRQTKSESGCSFFKKGENK